MNAASTSHRRGARTKLLLIDQGQVSHRKVGALGEILRPGDLLVVNDSATLPASFAGQFEGAPIELRLMRRLTEDYRNWEAVLFGEGDWRTPTEKRPSPPNVRTGELLEFHGLRAEVLAVSPISPRLLTIRWRSAEVLGDLYREGRPIQYSYLKEELGLWDQQTIFAGPPVSVEPPSASFALSWEMILALRARGVALASLTHAAGISSTGDPAIDRRLPFPENYFIPESTARAIEEARHRGGRIIAAGTTVVRALEASQGRAGAGVATLRLNAESRLRIVDGLLSGLHEAGASHLDLLSSLTDREVLSGAYRQAESRGYLWHEYGDVCLILKAA
ncbi:MAG: S-adenosylmethionine:tRNA ribosyltransferase-isomerase [Bdellovibrionota bacterium]